MRSLSLSQKYGTFFLFVFRSVRRHESQFSFKNRNKFRSKLVSFMDCRKLISNCRPSLFIAQPFLRIVLMDTMNRAARGNDGESVALSSGRNKETLRQCRRNEAKVRKL